MEILFFSNYTINKEDLRQLNSLFKPNEIHIVNTVEEARNFIQSNLIVNSKK